MRLQRRVGHDSDTRRRERGDNQRNYRGRSGNRSREQQNDGGKNYSGTRREGGRIYRVRRTSGSLPDNGGERKKFRGFHCTRRKNPGSGEKFNELKILRWFDERI